MISGKIWGHTSVIEYNSFIKTDHAFITKGMRCSKHCHDFMWNGFLVIKGRFLIRVWQPSGTVDETILGPGDYTKVAPGIFHRFECLEDAECVEIYWPEFNHADIRREDVGGKTNYTGPIDA